MNNPEFRGIVTNAIRYWERGRIFYNLALAVVVATVSALNWQTISDRVSLDRLLELFMLVVLANVAYCAAYVADLLAQLSDFRQNWIRSRWILWLIGTLFACAWVQFVVRGSLATA